MDGGGWRQFLNGRTRRGLEIVLICVVLYGIPRTAPFGAIVLTGFLGGAVASQLRIGKPLLGYTLFPIYLAALAGVGLYLRDSRVRTLFAPRIT